MICFEIFGLQYGESSDYEDEEHREYTRLWYSVDGIDGECFAESLLEHLECGEEDDEKTDPLDRWIFHQEIGDISRCDYHEDDREYESDDQIDDIAVTRSSYCEYIVQ